MKTELESTQTDSKRLREEMNILKNTVQQVIFCENVNSLSINKSLSRCFWKKVPFWEIFNRQIGHLGIKIRGLEWKFWEFYMILEYFSLGKGLFTGRWWMRGKIPDQWPNLRLILHTWKRRKYISKRGTRFDIIEVITCVHIFITLTVESFYVHYCKNCGIYFAYYNHYLFSLRASPFVRVPVCNTIQCMMSTFRTFNLNIQRDLFSTIFSRGQ